MQKKTLARAVGAHHNLGNALYEKRRVDESRKEKRGKVYISSHKRELTNICSSYKRWV